MNKEYYDNWWINKEYLFPKKKHNVALDLVSNEMFPIIDMGCGNGILISELEKKYSNKEVFGIDSSATAIKKKVCKSNIIEFDIEKWEDYSEIKTVILVDVIEHMLNPYNLIKKISENVKNIIIVCPNFNFINQRFQMLFGKIPFQNKISRGGHVFWCQYIELKRMFNDLGLKIKKENHLYPKESIKSIKVILKKRPSVFAHEFAFLLVKQ